MPCGTSTKWKNTQTSVYDCDLKHWLGYKWLKDWDTWNNSWPDLARQTFMRSWTHTQECNLARPDSKSGCFLGVATPSNKDWICKWRAKKLHKKYCTQKKISGRTQWAHLCRDLCSSTAGISDSSCPCEVALSIDSNHLKVPKKLS